MTNHVQMRGLIERHRVRTAERIQREKQMLDLFAINERRLGRELAEAVGVSVRAVHRSICRLRAEGHRIGAARGYGYVYSGGPK